MNMPKSRDIQAKILLPQAIWNEFGLRSSVNYNNSTKKTDFSFLKICLFCKYFYIIHFFHALPELTIYKNILSIIYLRSV